MIIKFKDPNRRIHGKLHKCDPFYFRYHYGEQRLVYISKPYIDRPTEKQKASREAFTALRQEVARQLHDPKLKARWEARFQRDKEGYKMLHTYVYAKLKAGETVIVESQYMTARDMQPAQGTQPYIVVYNGTIMPFFLREEIPKDSTYKKREKIPKREGAY